MSELKLTNSVARIEALIGRNDMFGTAWRVAAAAVDAMLEDGTETHSGWAAADAIELARHAVADFDDLGEDDEAEVVAAVQAAVDMLDSLAIAPKGIVLINGNNAKIWAIGFSIGELQSTLALHLTLSEVSRDYRVSSSSEGAIYRAVEIGLLDWQPTDAWRVEGIGETVGYWLGLERDAA